MKFWKFEYPGETEMQNCVLENRLPNRAMVFSGLKDTYSHPFESMVVGDCVFLANLSGDEARFFAVGKVLGRKNDTVVPTIKWVATKFGRFPDVRGGLPHWQTKTAFEISASPAKRYGLFDQVNYYVKNDA